MRAGGSPALLVLLPVAVAMLGSAFSHDVELAAALPAALLLSRRSWAARVAVVALAMPWGSGWRGLPLALAATSGAARIALPSATLVRQLAFAAVATVALFTLDKRLPLPATKVGGVHGAPAVSIAAGNVSARAWMWRIRLDPAYSDLDLRTLARKVPLWLALALVAAASLEGPITRAAFAAIRRRRYRTATYLP